MVRTQIILAANAPIVFVIAKECRKSRSTCQQQPCPSLCTYTSSEREVLTSKGHSTVCRRAGILCYKRYIGDPVTKREYDDVELDIVGGLLLMRNLRIDRLLFGISQSDSKF